MGDSSMPSEAALSAARGAKTGTDARHREVRIEHHYHGPVSKVEYAENVYYGNNYGTLNLGSDRPHSDLIRLLQPILDASHTRDRNVSPPNSACFPGTRMNIIRRIVAWVNSTLLWNTHVLWLYGYVGCGKSAIALAIALNLEERGRLVGSFFFFRNAGDRSRMTKFAATLACQLAAAIPEAAPFIEKAVQTKPGLLHSSLVAQLRHLVYEPFKAVVWGRRLLWTYLLKGPFLNVIDGLDECEDRQDVEGFIDDLLDFFKKNPLVPLRFLITSRVEQHLQGRLEQESVYLENLVNYCSRNDIDTFMGTCFDEEKKRNAVIKAYIREHGDWPTKEDKEQLVDHVNGSIIFASALFKYIAEPTGDGSTPMDRLPHTLNMNPGLDTLYAKTLSRSQHLPHFSDVLSTLALLFKPIPIVGIAQLLGIKTFEVIQVLVNLQAIIHIPGTDDLPVAICHTSLRDFLTSKIQSGIFFVPPSYHLKLSRCYFSLHLDHLLNNTLLSLGTQDREQRYRDHWNKFLSAVPEQSIITEQKPSSHLPHRTLSYHLYSFTQNFLWLFGENFDHWAERAIQALTRCIESLALAVECDTTPDRWLQRDFGQLGIRGPMKEEVHHLKIDQEQATALQRNVQRIEMAVGVKVPLNFFRHSMVDLTLLMQCSSRLSATLSSPSIDHFDGYWWLEEWTAMRAYRFLEWMNGRIQAELDLAGPGVPCNFDLDCTNWYHMTLRKALRY